jgi:predicted AAA+ superfamily ATPase
MREPELPLRGNYNPNNYKLYFRDTGLLVASLDEEAQQDLRNNRNFNTYKGALFENIVSQTLGQQGYPVYFYRDDKSSLKIDFLVRDAHTLVPIEVKANNGPSRSLQKMIESPAYKDVQYGIKLGHTNIGRTDTFYTFPYFLTFLLKRFLRERPA